MTWKTPVAGSLLAFVLTSSLWAAPPDINMIMPFGIRRGEPMRVGITGSNLAGNPRLIAPFRFTVNTKAAPGQGTGPTRWEPEITVAPDVAIGVYPVRVQTDDGISNPMPFAVGQLPQVTEKEENNSVETAQLLAGLPVVVEGMAQGNDVDFYKFAGKKGQKIVLDAQCARIGSGVDPTIRLTRANAERTFIASADESPGLLTDCRVAATLPDDGDYIVEISDSRYQGGGRPSYRLTVGAVPMAEELFPLGARSGETVGLELRGGTISSGAGDFSIAAATPRFTATTDRFQPGIVDPHRGVFGTAGTPLDVESLSPLIVGRFPEMHESNDASLVTKGVPPVVFNGRIGRPGESDSFKVAVVPGQRLNIKVLAAALGSTLDGVLAITGLNGAAIGSADDQTIPGPPKNNQPTSVIDADPALELTVPGGTTEVTLALRDLEGRGGVGFPYRILVEPIVPSFTLNVAESQVSIPRGGTASMPVTLVRKGFTGAITVTVLDPPAGLTVRPALIAPGQVVGAFSLSASADASFGATTLNVVGRGQEGTGTVEAVATKTIRFVESEGIAIHAITFQGLATAPALPTPVTFTTPAEIEVAHGFGASIPVDLVRTKGSDAAFTISPVALPPGLAVPNAPIAEKATKGSVAVTAAAETAFGSMTIGLLAKGKIANVDRTFALPAVTLKMVRPAEMQLNAFSLDVKAGATVELKGKVIRRGSFKEPVTIKVNGLPAGLTAAPVTVPPTATDFVVKVVADAKAAVATAKSQVAFAFQVNKKDYPTTPSALAVKVLAAK